MKAQSSEGERCLSDYIGEFLNYLENKKHLSPHTVFHYGHDLSLFVRYLSLKNKCTMLEVKLENVKDEHIDGFLNYLVEERNNCLRSAKRRLSAIRSFYTYISNMLPKFRDTLGNPATAVPIPRVNEPLPKILTDDEVISLLRAARSHSPFPPRDYAILRLFLNCGARLSEVLELEIDDFNQSNGTIRFGRNTRRERNLPLSPETLHAMVTYLTTRPLATSERIFINRLGNPITKGAVYHLLGRCLSAASLSDKGITIHSLRHTCFANLAREGFSPDEIRSISGLRRVQTTRIYERIASDKPINKADDEKEEQ